MRDTRPSPRAPAASRGCIRTAPPPPRAAAHPAAVGSRAAPVSGIVPHALIFVFVASTKATKLDADNGDDLFARWGLRQEWPAKVRATRRRARSASLVSPSVRPTSPRGCLVLQVREVLTAIKPVPKEGRNICVPPED